MRLVSRLALAASLSCACGDSGPEPGNEGAGADAAPVTETIVLATTDGAGEVLFDGETIYWAGGAALWRIERDGSGLQKLADEPTHAEAIALTADRLLWVTPGAHAADFRNGAIRSVALDGGEVQLVAERWFPVDLAVHEDRIHWVEIDGGWRASSRLDGSDLEELERAETGFPSLAAGAAGIAWATSGNTTARVMLQPADGGPARVLAEEQTGPDDLLLDGGDLFFTSHVAFGDDPASVMRADTEGGGAEVLLTDLAARPGIALDGDHLYVADGPGGRILRLPRTGGAAEVIAAGQPGPVAVAARGSAVVFTCADGSVRLLEP